MGGGSAQVNPPYQASVADGPTVLLGDAVTVPDGVEVRTRPVPAPGGFLTDPKPAGPERVSPCWMPTARVIEERLSPPATTLIGFDDDFEETVHQVRFRARINASQSGRSARRHRAGRPAGHHVPHRGCCHPAWSVAPVNGDIEYTEGTFIPTRMRTDLNENQPE